MTDTGNISDGYHTFNELYEHRSALFIVLMRSHPEISWYSLRYPNGSMVEEYMFIAGMHLPTGQITYHMYINPYFEILEQARDVTRLYYAPAWDGHDSKEVVRRLILAWTVP